MFAGATHDRADEATQKAMIDVDRKWTSIDNHAAWVRRAAFSHFYKIKEWERRQRELEGAHLELLHNSRAGDDPLFWDDETSVKELLDSLTAGQREVVELLIKDFTQSEIADLLGRSYDAVRRSLSDARKRMQLLLEQRSAGNGNSNPTQRKEVR